MKPNTATFTSFLRPAVAAFAILFMIGWVEEVTMNPLPLSPPLRDQKTHIAVREVSKHAQEKQTEVDTTIRIIPRVNTDQFQNPMEVCCLHANILDFYLHNILNHYEDLHPSMHQLKTDLHRVSRDLKDKGCNVTHYHDHHDAVQFRQKLGKMEGNRGITKAVGEIDILFTYLNDYCETPKQPDNQPPQESQPVSLIIKLT